MPTHLPEKPRAKALDGHRRRGLNERIEMQTRIADKRRQHATDKADVIDRIDWLALFVLSLAASAVFMASLIYFGEGDAIGATAILAGTAGINALALLVTKSPVDRD